jgi:hypothetical protein
MDIYLKFVVSKSRKIKRLSRNIFIINKRSNFLDLSKIFNALQESNYYTTFANKPPIPMMPEENVVPLVVKRDSALANKLRLIVKEGGQHPKKI